MTENKLNSRRRVSAKDSSFKSSDSPVATASYARGFDAAQENFDNQRENSKLSGVRYNYGRRFWAGDIGKDYELVVLDYKVDDVVSLFEHEIWDSVKRKVSYEPCVNALGNKKPFDCPICAKGYKHSYVLLLTVLDLTPYVNKDGVEVPYSRKLLALKSNSLPAIGQILKSAERKYGTCRGTMIVLNRGNKSKDYPKIGVPQMFSVEKEDGSEEDVMYDFYSEEDLVSEFGHPKILSKDGSRVIFEENEQLQPFDYNSMLSIPDYSYFEENYSNLLSSAQSSTSFTGSDQGGYVPPNADDQEQSKPSTRRRKQRSISSNSNDSKVDLDDDIPFGTNEV